VDSPLEEVDEEAEAAASGRGQGVMSSEMGEAKKSRIHFSPSRGGHAGEDDDEDGHGVVQQGEQEKEEERDEDALMMGGPASGHGGPVDLAVVKRPALRPIASGLFAPEDDHLRLEGYLYKQSKSLLRLWLRRYWVTEGPLLLYWRDETDRGKPGAAGLPQAAIDLRFCTDLRLVPEDPLAFELEGTEVGVYKLRASTNQEARLWYSGLLCVLFEYGCLA